MKTLCVGCSKTLATPEKAAEHHTAKHRRVKRAVGGVINGSFVSAWSDDTPGIYRDGERWGEFAERREVTDLTPQITLKDFTGRPASEISEPAISGHVGCNWADTACLCGCHYDKPECDTKGCS